MHMECTSLMLLLSIQILARSLYRSRLDVTRQIHRAYIFRLCMAKLNAQNRNLNWDTLAVHCLPRILLWNRLLAMNISESIGQKKN